MMDAPPEDLRTIGDTEYMSTPQLQKEISQKRQSTISELSGRPLENEAEVHHKDRVDDKPERALDRTDLTVI